MAGIQSLMQAPQGQGQMPGQAPQQPMPGMMPQQGPSGPGIAPNPFAGEKLDKLLYLYRNPQLIPEGETYRVITALSEAVKGAQRAQQMAGQQAIAQNAQMQQQPPVAEGLAQQAESLLRGRQQAPVMAAHGGIMHGYAGGGAVAFQHGGPVQKFQYGAGPRGIMAQPSMLTTIEGVPIYTPGPDKEPGETEAEYLARKQKEAAEADEVSNRPLRRFYRYLAEKIRAPSPVAQMRTPAAQAAPAAVAASPATQPTVTDLLAALEPPKGPMMDVPEIQIAPSPAPSPAPTAGPRRQSVAPPPPAAPTQGLQNLVDLDKAQKEELDRLQGRQAVDPTVAAARAAERKGAEELAAGRQTRAEAQRTEAQRQLDETLKRGRTSLLDDPEALLRVAAGIDTRRGKGMGTFAGGIADIMGQRRAEATAARKDFQTAQNAYNQEMNALDTLRQLQRERDTAIATGDVAAARAIQDQITNVNRFYQKAKEDRQVAERNYQLDVLKTQATQDQARASLIQAGREPEKIRMMRTLGIPITEAGFKTFVEIEATGRLEGAVGRNNVAALRELGEWEKGLGANIKAMNAKNPQVYEDARRAKIQEINATLGATIPLGGGAGQVDTNNPLLKK